MNSTLISIEEDEEGEWLMVFHPALLEQLGWEIGDTLTWTIGDDGRVIIAKETQHGKQ